MIDSTIQFYLKLGVLAPSTVLEISEKRFGELSQSRNTLSGALDFEEYYWMIIQNFRELEEEVAKITIDQMITLRLNRDYYSSVRLNLNTKIQNFLSTVKLYLDLLENLIRRCSSAEPSKVKKLVKELTAREYDSNFYYRFMEALRNYTQHSGGAINHGQVNMRWTKNEEGDFDKMEHSMLILSSKDQFTNKNFKTAILNELPEEINLLSAIRSYLESISTIHQELRNFISTEVTKSREILESTLNDYSQANGGKIIPLFAYGVKESEELKVYINLDSDDVRIKWINHNRQLTNLSKRFFTSEQNG